MSLAHIRSTLLIAAVLAVAPTLGAQPTATADAARAAAISPVRRWAAPYAAEVAAPHDAGTLLDGLDLPPADSRETGRRFQLLDRIVLTMPRGIAPTPGTAVLLVRPGPSLGGAQVLIPTGVAVVETRQSGFVIARLERVFDVVEAGHAVVPMPPDASRGAAAASATRETRVAWIAGSAELPSLQSVVLLAAGARDGVREGDEYELMGDGRRLPGGPTLPATRAAVVRVIRVTEQGASAVIESQTQPAIVSGMRAVPLVR